MSPRTLEIEIADAVATVWMNRPALHNALNEQMINELTAAFSTLSQAGHVRVIVLSGRGKSFSAGADIDSMKLQGSAPFESNLANARALAAMFHSIATAPKPTIARVNGAALGGGFGLVAACDIAIASGNAVFATPEVRLGLIPSTIAPYVLAAVGPRHALRLFLSGERIDAAHAEKIGLIHESVALDQLDARLDAITHNLLAGGPLAQRAAKSLIRAIDFQPVTDELIEDTAVRIANIRSEPEASEGLSAFLEKRPAAWVPQKP
jgi:methylglutaconyl-CoA hydratase